MNLMMLIWIKVFKKIFRPQIMPSPNYHAHPKSICDYLRISQSRERDQRDN
jgi:hypothetical protein